MQEFAVFRKPHQLLPAYRCQRVALARASCRKRPLCSLDELMGADAHYATDAPEVLSWSVVA